MAGSAKQANKWGTFLSQAVAGVEARLDTILGEDEASPQIKGSSNFTSGADTIISSSASKSAPAPSRTASSNRANDRLQERLARAMAAKLAGSESDQAGCMQSTSTPKSPRQSSDSPEAIERRSIEPFGVSPVEAASRRASQEVTRKSRDSESRLRIGPGNEAHKDGDFHTDLVATANVLQDREPKYVSDSAAEADGEDGCVNELMQKLEIVHVPHQEEIHSYIERIDALEVKLQFLAREATKSAREDALAAAPGSTEKKLAEKDQKIAQLMEEGKNLASTERKYRALIKMLRAKSAEDQTELQKLSSERDKTKKEQENLRRRAHQADEMDKAHKRLQEKLEQCQRELGAVRSDLRTKDATIADLKTQLHKTVEQVAKADNEMHERNRQRVAELEETVANLQLEKTLTADRAKAQANELREMLDRTEERSRAQELEMKVELQTMESKLEVMRMHAEEASSGATGDWQAKLLRQVENLQLQYSVASENWQGIETQLQARTASLERERDEALQRESEMRKKAREASLRAKRKEEELEETRTRVPATQDVKRDQEQVERWRKRAEEAEAALATAKSEMEKQRQSLKDVRESRQTSRPLSRPSNDRRRWTEDVNGAAFLSKPRSDSSPGSPRLAAPSQQTSSSFMIGNQPVAARFRKPSVTSSSYGYAGLAGGFLSGPPSASELVMLPVSPTVEAEPVPMALTAQHSLGQGREEAIDSLEMSFLPQEVPQDLVSVSAVAAGPSVQLVERMSAAIRRLESEKVAARDELVRISKQREEARAEIVALMREVEANKAAVARMAGLEADVADMKARHETTLEMLGEKSELVDELRIDVEDVKAMYRDLVERTVR